MNKQRYYELSTNLELKLTEEEFLSGWHFCPDWGDMLINKFDPSSESCSCDGSNKE